MLRIRCYVDVDVGDGGAGHVDTSYYLISGNQPPLQIAASDLAAFRARRLGNVVDAVERMKAESDAY